MPQHDDDEQADAAAISSARWAYLLFRAPVMVAVHADQMLSRQERDHGRPRDQPGQRGPDRRAARRQARRSPQPVAPGQPQPPPATGCSHRSRAELAPCKLSGRPPGRCPRPRRWPPRPAGADAAESSQFTDPRQGIGLLTDRSPLALLPVRMETRFVNVGQPRTLRAISSWVRIYPDDCSIDTFEATLSATELSNAKLYWQGIWRAGGDGRRRARGLARPGRRARLGPGRLHRRHLPAGEPGRTAGQGGRQRTRSSSSPPRLPLSAAEVRRAQRLLARGLARGRRRERAAGRHRGARRGTSARPRAETLIARLRAVQPADAPAPPATKHDVACSTAFVVVPADPAAKQASWSQAPQVAQLPERFVVLGYTRRDAVAGGHRRPGHAPAGRRPRPIAPTPSDDDSPRHGDLSCPTSCAGWSTSTRAVAAGMGLSRSTSTQNRPRTASTGCSCSACRSAPSDADGGAALEELLQHHHVGLGGLETLVRRARPTHNTTGHRHRHTAARQRRRELRRPRAAPLFSADDRPAAAGGTGSGSPRPSASTRPAHNGARRRRRGPAAGAGDAARACGPPRSATGWTRC